MAFAGMATVAGTPAQAATGPEYVALGDSYASGVGAGPYDPASGACRRSPMNYPHQWAAAHPKYTLKDVTCSGATIADVRKNQLSALSGTTGFVTLTVGGNDAQFAKLVQTCLTKDDATCKDATDRMSSYARNQLVTELAALYRDIKVRAPRALILVLGYPRTVAPTGTCSVTDLGPVKRTAVNGLADALAEGTRAASMRAPVHFLDMRARFTGHGACGSDPWITDLNDPAAVFHPNLAGYTKGYTARLNAIWSCVRRATRG
ncbi:SGNH/GDSL hydrolase family protein [Streptomyces sp. NPDC050988]|uniref:SGNH/GDSL hydrolase family protein n=1 Tax=Streptomyces sp. NPDC050988 TaxID=3365637 RepID=UPI003798AF21